MIGCGQDYLKHMFETFEMAEELHSITDLHILFTMMHTIRAISHSEPLSQA